MDRNTHHWMIDVQPECDVERLAMLPQGRNRKSEPDHRLMIEPRRPFRCTTANARSANFRNSFFPWKVDKPLPLGRSRTH